MANKPGTWKIHINLLTGRTTANFWRRFVWSTSTWLKDEKEDNFVSSVSPEDGGANLKAGGLGHRKIENKSGRNLCEGGREAPLP